MTPDQWIQLAAIVVPVLGTITTTVLTLRSRKRRGETDDDNLNG